MDARDPWRRIAIGPKKTTSPYTLVRIRRERLRKNSLYPKIYNPPCELFKKDGHDKWVSLGTFDTEDEALDMLELEVRIMNIIEMRRGALD